MCIVIFEFGLYTVFNIKELLFFQSINTCCTIHGSGTRGGDVLGKVKCSEAGAGGNCPDIRVTRGMRHRFEILSVH